MMQATHHDAPAPMNAKAGGSAPRRVGRASRMLLCLALLGLCLAVALPARATGEGEDPETDQSITLRIIEADPTVVPLLRSFLQAAKAKGKVEEESRMTRTSIWGLGRAQDRESLPLMEWAYTQGVKGRLINSSAAYAIAETGGPEAERILKRIMWDESQSIGYRCHAASALVRLDSDDARAFLLLQFDLYCLQRRMLSPTYLGATFQVFRRLGDAKLIEALKQRLATEPNEMLQTYITKTLEPMEVLVQPMAGWMDIAANTKITDRKYRRYQAIQGLGEHGDPTHIPFLESLKPWDGDATQTDQNTLKLCADVAIKRIRQRHWAAFLQDAAPAPAAEAAEAEGE